MILHSKSVCITNIRLTVFLNKWLVHPWSRMPLNH